MVGNGSGGIFHVFKDNIIRSRLRLIWTYVRGRQIVRQTEESGSHIPPANGGTLLSPTLP